jgi:hypothetical protein
VETTTYLGTFWVALPVLLLFIVLTYWTEFMHIYHGKHEQHARLLKAAKEL